MQPILSRRDTLSKYVNIIIGSVLYSFGIILFITPLNLFSGGAMGLAQLIRDVLVNIIGLNIPPNFDLSGILYYVINVPLLILAYKRISKYFFIKTIISVTAITATLSLFNINELIIDDTLTCCVIGGLLSGIGTGLVLRSGGSGGGLDILGMYLTKNRADASVGKVSLVFNVILYTLCAIMSDIPTAIYSIIFSAIGSFTVDNLHSQNIKMQALIFTKVDNVAQPIMEKLGRGVTEWQGDGAYTHESTHILVTVISKYEVLQLRRIVLSIDPKAFISYTQISGVFGNFEKKL